MPQKLSPWAILTSDEKHLSREQSPECTPQVRQNAADLAERVSRLLDLLEVKSVKVSSGFRTVAANQAAKGSKNSSHLRGCAVDLSDSDGVIDALIDASESVLVTCDLYREHPSKTAGWVHLSTEAPKSGLRTFMP